MKYSEFESRIHVQFPGAQIEEDNEGQLIIYTGLTHDRDTNLVMLFELEEEEKIDA